MIKKRQRRSYHIAKRREQPPPPKKKLSSRTVRGIASLLSPSTQICFFTLDWRKLHEFFVCVRSQLRIVETSKKKLYCLHHQLTVTLHRAIKRMRQVMSGIYNRVRAPLQIAATWCNNGMTPEPLPHYPESVTTAAVAVFQSCCNGN